MTFFFNRFIFSIINYLSMKCSEENKPFFSLEPITETFSEDEEKVDAEIMATFFSVPHGEVPLLKTCQ